MSGHLAVSRYLGYYVGERRARSATFLIGLFLLILIPALTLLALGIMTVFSSHIDWLRQVDRSILLSTACLAASLSFGLLVFSLLRGWGHPLLANLQQLAFVSSLLALSLAAERLTVGGLVYAASVAGAVVNIFFLAWLVNRHRSEIVQPKHAELRSIGSKIVRYSLPRLADGPCQASLPLIGVLMAPAIGGMILAGYIHIGQTIVRMTEVAMVPLSVIFLPLTAKNVRAGRFEALRVQSQHIYDGICILGFFGVIQAMIWAGPLLQIVFKDEYASAGPILLLTIPAMLPNLLYAGFRSFIDGYSTKPINFFNLLASMFLILAGSVFAKQSHSSTGLVVSYTLGVSLLGCLSVGYVKHELGIRLFSRNMVFVIAGSACSGGVALLSRESVRGGSDWLTLVIFSLTEIALGLSYLLWLLNRGHSVLILAKGRLYGGGHQEQGAPEISKRASDVESVEVV